jgi:hypothetical protein
LLDDIRIRMMTEVELYFYKQQIYAKDKEARQEDLQYATDSIGTVISFRNEASVLLRVKQLLEKRLSLFPTIIEKDRQLLGSNLTFNMRNIVLYRLGQKELLIQSLQYLVSLQALLYAKIDSLNLQDNIKVFQ